MHSMPSYHNLLTFSVYLYNNQTENKIRIRQQALAFIYTEEMVHTHTHKGNSCLSAVFKLYNLQIHVIKSTNTLVNE